MLLEQLKNNSFSKIYRVYDISGPKVLKIYKKNKFFDLNCPTPLKSYQKNLNVFFKGQLTVKHQVISDQILKIDLIKGYEQPTINNFFLKSLKNFQIAFKKIRKLKVNKDIMSLSHKVNQHIKLLSKEPIFKKFRINPNKVKKYIEMYEQNTFCHGDLHFENIFINKKNCIFIDWDYCTMATAGYDLAMLCYLENFNKKQIKQLAVATNIEVKEIEHYIPIAQLLEFFYQLQLSKLSGKSFNLKPFEKIKSFLPYIT